MPYERSGNEQGGVEPGHMCTTMAGNEQQIKELLSALLSTDNAIRSKAEVSEKNLKKDLNLL